MKRLAVCCCGGMGLSMFLTGCGGGIRLRRLRSNDALCCTVNSTNPRQRRGDHRLSADTRTGHTNDQLYGVPTDAGLGTADAPATAGGKHILRVDRERQREHIEGKHGGDERRYER